jgi:hypothetical protein
MKHYAHGIATDRPPWRAAAHAAVERKKAGEVAGLLSTGAASAAQIKPRW